MSDKKEIISEKSKNEQPQGTVNNERPQSIYIKNSAETVDKVSNKETK